MPVDLVVDGLVRLSGHRCSLRQVDRRSSAVELRCAAFPERGQAFFEIRCPAGQLQVEQFLVHRLGQRGVLAVVDGLLGQPDRDRRGGGQLCEQLFGGVVEVCGGRRRRGSAPSPRHPMPVTFSPSSSIRLARARPTSRGSSHVAPESGLKPRVTNGSQNTASSAATVKSAASARLQPRPTAQPRTVHTTGRWMVCDELDQPMRGVGDATDQIAGARPLAAGIGGDPVGAGAEVVAFAANVDGPQRVVGGGRRQRVDERVDHRMAQRVTPCRPVEREPQNRAVPVRGHRTVSGADFLTHCRVPS